MHSRHPPPPSTGSTASTCAHEAFDAQQYGIAIKHSKQAIELATAQKGGEDAIKAYTARTLLYGQKKPYRDEKK